MATQTQPRSTGDRAAGLLGSLLRWLLIIALIAVLGIALWYGATAAYTTVTDNTARIDQLEQNVAAEQAAVTNQFAARDSRITTLEGDLLMTQQELNQLVPEVQGLTEQLGALEARAATIDESLSALQSESETLAGTVSTLEQEGAELSQSLTDIDTALFNAEDNVAQAQQEIQSLQRAALLVSAQGNVLNAQQAITARNAGTATTFVERARDSLTLAAGLGADETSEGIQSLLVQLDTISAQLEADPFATEALLQGAWRALDSLIVANLPAIEAPAAEGEATDGETLVGEDAPVVDEGEATDAPPETQEEAPADAESEGDGS